jgi:hypothetical protein
MGAWNGAGSPFRFNVGTGHKFKVGAVVYPTSIAETYHNPGDTTTFNYLFSYSTSGEAGRYDVQNVATHELGHWLKLLDLNASGTSGYTMYYSISTGETMKRSLETDDKNGIKAIYP